MLPGQTGGRPPGISSFQLVRNPTGRPFVTLDIPLIFFPCPRFGLLLCAFFATTTFAAERELPEVCLWKTSAEAGDLNARWQLILKYCNYSPHDYVEAAQMLLANAQRGDGNSADLLAQIYLTGEGVPKNYLESVRWFKKAVEFGNTYALYHLGLRFEAGEGVPRDNGEAYFWYLTAAALQTNDGFRQIIIKRRDQLEKKLTADKVSEAQKQSMRWVEEIGRTNAH